MEELKSAQHEVRNEFKLAQGFRILIRGDDHLLSEVADIVNSTIEPSIRKDLPEIPGLVTLLDLLVQTPQPLKFSQLNVNLVRVVRSPLENLEKALVYNNVPILSLCIFELKADFKEQDAAGIEAFIKSMYKVKTMLSVWESNKSELVKTRWAIAVIQRVKNVEERKVNLVTILF
eukprot:TRINITY_DN11757_c0_g1_i1.p1 TRINITY_DN11757_c0_g1~~TRINITY_DN11757_c0_g1_i1.p1  ORF type:complete len:175 (+),score=16.24 TRINITY_DN11757_c0_g1_i1:179-703(+)